MLITALNRYKSLVINIRYRFLINSFQFPGKAAAAFGVDPKALFKAFCKPRIKVGTEWVTKGQTCEQATMSTGGIARAIFDRVFKWWADEWTNSFKNCFFVVAG